MLVYYLDDERALCEIFKEFFNDEDTKVVTFTKAKEAIDSCNVDKPDLIFIDYRLSETSGDKVASALDDTIPKVLVTGELDMPDGALFFEVIAKPFKLASIKGLIESFRQGMTNV